MFVAAATLSAVMGAPDSAQAYASNSSFTGTVTAPSFGNYSGTRIYISARNQFDGTAAGTSVVCPGPGHSVQYTINGLNSGGYYSPYTLEAFIDRLGTAYRHLSDPSTSQLTYYAYSGANTANLGIVTYSPPSPAAPAAPTAVAGDRAVLLSWDSQRNTAGVEIPDAFRVGWTTDPTFSTGVTYSAELPANSNNNYIVQGLTNGTTYYFAVESIVYADASTKWISPTGSIKDATPAAPGGGATVGGTLITPAPGALSGPAYVVLLDAITSNPVSFYASSSSATSSPFALAGVPDGQYRLLAFVDLNNSNRLDQGDIHLPSRQTIPVTVSGGAATCASGPCTIDLTGYQVGSLVDLTTLNWSDQYSGSQGYQLNFTVNGVEKTPASAVISGPQLASKGSIAIVQEGGHGVKGSFAVPLAPATSDSYSVIVTYTDGTTETIPATVSGFVSGLPANLAPGSGNAVYLPALPAFTWTLPDTSTNTVDFHINSIYSQLSIDVTGLAPNTLSYNLASRAGTTLPNDYYTWGIASVDANGNSAEARTRFWYYLDNIPPAVSISPPGGTYPSARYVTLSANDNLSGVKALYYTTDGTDPLTSSTRKTASYSTSFLVTANTTVKSYALDYAGTTGTASAVTTANYTISDTTAPTVTSVTPAAASVQISYGSSGAYVSISAVFNELIDPASVAAATVSITRDGVPLTGVTGATSDNQASSTTTMNIYTSSSLQAGTYTVRIAGTVRDLAGNLMGSDYSWTFTVSESFSVSTASGNGYGTFTCNGAACASSYPYGTSVVIQAIPDSGSVFIGWGGACSGTVNPCTVTVSDSTTVTGSFAQNLNVTMTSSTGNSGTLTCNGGSCSSGVAYGATVAVKAIPGAGSVFAGWGGACSGTTGDTCNYVANGIPAYAGVINGDTLGGVPDEGNLSITLGNDGRIGVRRFSSGAWINQVFSWSNKGSMLYSSSDTINLGYFGGSTIPTFDQSRSGLNSDKTSYVSVWTTPGLTVTQTVTYQPADRYYRLQWDILNNGASDLSDLRFFHGQDSYFDGNDRGAGFWDAPNNTVGVQRTYGSSLRRMYLQGVTQPFAYESQYYSTVRSDGEGFALTDTIDPSEDTDNGYALEWRLGSGDPPYKSSGTGWTGANLAPGATWTILAYEKFSDVAITGGVSVNAPITASCATGAPCNLNFTVTNTGNVSQTISLAASSDQSGWAPSPVSNSITLAAGLSQQINVTFSVPVSSTGTAPGHVTLTANGLSSDTTAVTITTTTFAVDAIAGAGGNIAPQSANVALNGTTTFTVTPNSGYTIGSVSGCGGTLAGSIYTTGTITAACTVNAIFVQAINVTATAGPGGSITPSGITGVVQNGIATFTVTPDSGYSIGTVSGCGGTLTGSSYVTGHITAPCTVSAFFTPNITSISGTITYTGSKTGRIYVLASSANSGYSYGTSIGAPGTFTIRGLPAGMYTVTAFMDNQGLGEQVQTSPTGQVSSVLATTVAVTGTNITLADPAAVAPPAPKNVRVRPGDASVLVGWDVNRTNVVDPADNYDIYWSTAATVGKTSFSGSRTGIPAGNAPVIITGLTNATAYYFVVVPKSGGVEGAASPVVGPVIIGATSGANTVSGTVTFSGITPTGPLHVAVVDGSKNGKVFYTSFASPVSPQNFSIAGVPDGAYSVYAILDMNNDKLIGLGDIMNTDDSAPMITLSGSGASNVVVPLTQANVNAAAFVRTEHQMSGSSEWYNVNFGVRGQLKRPVAVTLQSGPNITGPVDLGLREGEFSGWTGGQTRPAVGGTYTFQVKYADNTTETLFAAVATVLDSFPATPHINGVLSTVPTFAWDAPVSTPPVGFQYQLWVNGNDYGNSMWETRLPAGQLSAVYNFDGGENQPLTAGNSYIWTIAVRDTYGNRAAVSSLFVPVASGTVFIATPSLGRGAYNSAYYQQLQATGGTGAYVWNMSSGNLPQGLSLTNAGVISGIPTRAGTYAFTVQVTDSAAASQAASRTFTIDIDRATPAITWPVPAAIAYGTALSAAQLNATADVPGTFAYTPAAGTIPKPGNQTLSVTFTPADSVNYSSRTIDVTLAVISPTGDINGDGIVDITDALLALQIAVGMKSATAAQLLAGDVAPLVKGMPAPDGTITVGDALVILQRAVGSYSW